MESDECPAEINGIESIKNKSSYKNVFFEIDPEITLPSANDAHHQTSPIDGWIQGILYHCFNTSAQRIILSVFSEEEVNFLFGVPKSVWKVKSYKFYKLPCKMNEIKINKGGAP
jgi:hypothetical protein